MAEPNTLAWMTEQRDRLKAEVDAVSAERDRLAAELADAVGIAAKARSDAEREIARIAADGAAKLEHAVRLSNQRRGALAKAVKALAGALEPIQAALLSE